MKKCFKCGQTLPLAAFYKHPRMKDGHLNKCKECTKKDAVIHYYSDLVARSEYERQRNLEPERKLKKLEYGKNHNKRNPVKTKARAKLRRFVRVGKIVKLPCEKCGNPKSQAHHEDYSKPLDVSWLCFKCHREAHGQIVVSQIAS